MLQDQPHGVGVGDAQFQCPLHMDALRQSVCVGDERTMEQDPSFVFRILVDIASKGCDRAGARDYAAFLGFFFLEPS